VLPQLTDNQLSVVGSSSSKNAAFPSTTVGLVVGLSAGLVALGGVAVYVYQTWKRAGAAAEAAAQAAAASSAQAQAQQQPEPDLGGPEDGDASVANGRIPAHIMRDPAMPLSEAGPSPLKGYPHLSLRLS
jgi:hypothetical protein